jgi:hypothetical protein
MGEKQTGLELPWKWTSNLFFAAISKLGHCLNTITLTVILSLSLMYIQRDCITTFRMVEFSWLSLILESCDYFNVSLCTFYYSG